jgi:uncharacterized membrane protein
MMAAGLMLGVGLGGFWIGIIFHQILQTHSMLSGRLPQNNLVNVKNEYGLGWYFFTYLPGWSTCSRNFSIVNAVK